MQKGLIFSIVAHLIIVLFMMVKLNFKSKPKVDIINAIRVDMIALPDNKKMPDKNLETVASPAVMPTKTPEKTPLPSPVKEIPSPKKIDEQIESLKKSKSKQKEALKKLQRLSAIEKIKDEIQNEKAKIAQPTAPKSPLKGEALSAGTRPTGLNRLEYDLFIAQIDSAIKSNWSLPSWLLDLNLKARAKVRIDPDGRLIGLEISQTSRNSDYDDFCLQAIEKSVPFPKVPDKFVDLFRQDGFTIGFPE